MRSLAIVITIVQSFSFLAQAACVRHACLRAPCVAWPLLSPTFAPLFFFFFLFLRLLLLTHFLLFSSIVFSLVTSFVSSLISSLYHLLFPLWMGSESIIQYSQVLVWPCFNLNLVYPNIGSYYSYFCSYCLREVLQACIYA